MSQKFAGEKSEAIGARILTKLFYRFYIPYAREYTMYLILIFRDFDRTFISSVPFFQAYLMCDGSTGDIPVTMTIITFFLLPTNLGIITKMSLSPFSQLKRLCL